MRGLIRVELHGRGRTWAVFGIMIAPDDAGTPRVIDCAPMASAGGVRRGMAAAEAWQKWKRRPAARVTWHPAEEET